MTQSWGISQQQMNLGWATAIFNLGMEQQHLMFQNKYWQQNFSMNVGQAMIAA